MKIKAHFILSITQRVENEINNYNELYPKNPIQLVEVVETLKKRLPSKPMKIKLTKAEKA